MEKYTVEGTNSIPMIDFDPRTHVLTIDGYTYPENAIKFYERAFNWIVQYLEGRDKEVETQLNLKLLYINTASSKCILHLLRMMETAYMDNHSIKINWYYEEDDDGMLEIIEDFQADIDIPVNVIELTE